MQTESQVAVLDQILDPVGRCLTVEAARKLVKLRASPSAQRRIDELAAGANEGTLTPDQQRQYEAFIAAANMFAILQAKARRILSK